MISWLRFKWRKYYRRYYLHTGGRAEKLRSAPDRLHVLKLHLVELTEQVIYLLKGDMRSRAGRSGRRGGITQDPARSDSVKGGTRSEEKRGEVRSQEQCISGDEEHRGGAQAGGQRGGGGVRERAGWCPAVL